MGGWPRLALQGKETMLRKKRAERDLEYSCRTAQHTFCVSKVRTKKNSLLKVFLHRVCEFSAGLDFQGIETLLHWPYRVLGRDRSTYLHLSLPSYSMALPLKKKNQPNSAIIFLAELGCPSPWSQSCNGITESKTLHGVSLQTDGLFGTLQSAGGSIPFS